MFNRSLLPTIPPTPHIPKRAAAQRSKHLKSATLQTAKHPSSRLDLDGNSGGDFRARSSQAEPVWMATRPSTNDFNKSCSIARSHVLAPCSSMQLKWLLCSGCRTVMAGQQSSCRVTCCTPLQRTCPRRASIMPHSHRLAQSAWAR